MKVTNVYDLKEYIKASDSCSPIRGYVVMTDEDGKTLFAKHNMIVEKGRELIRDLVYNNVFYTDVGGISTSKKERKAHFSSIKFGNSNDVTKPSDTALHSKEPISFNISLTNSINETINGGITHISNNNTEKCIHILTNINTTDKTAKLIISEAGLFFTEDSDETLFSRVAFAPITINSNHIYTLNYYIYF